MDEMSKKRMVGVLLFSTMLGSAGQLMFKLGILSSASSVLFLMFGLLAYGTSTLIYLYILGRTHLSWTYGITGLSYIFASVLALAILGEQISSTRWLGIGIIALGTALVGIS